MIPLDPIDGPTVWAELDEPHTVRIMEGTDPENPINEYYLAVAEVERLSEWLDDG